MPAPPHRSPRAVAGAAGRRRRRPQGLGPDHRLRRRQDFLRAYRTGRRRGGRFATLFFVANELDHARLGITASRKVGNSVARQRLKRRVREIYRRWEHRADLPPLDLVVNLKPNAREGGFAELRGELLRQMATLLPERSAASRPTTPSRPPAGGDGSAR